jgi:hypothetical protein
LEEAVWSDAIVNPDTELKGAARKREDGGGKQGRTWPKNGRRRRRRKEIKEERRIGERKKRISNSRKMIMQRGNTECPNVLSVTVFLCFLFSFSRNNYSTMVIKSTYKLIIA